jgi:hypothetical protein
VSRHTANLRLSHSVVLKEDAETIGVPDTPFETAEEACAAAADAGASGKYFLVRVWIETLGFLEEQEAPNLHDAWSQT